jgi:hypothetical protein
MEMDKKRKKSKHSSSKLGSKPTVEHEVRPVPSLEYMDESREQKQKKRKRSGKPLKVHTGMLDGNRRQNRGWTRFKGGKKA